MTKYREILRLTSLGLSQRDIMKSLGIAQKTVVNSKAGKRAGSYLVLGQHLH